MDGVHPNSCGRKFRPMRAFRRWMPEQAQLL